MFKELYKDVLRIDATEGHLSDEKGSKIFPVDRELDKILPECYKIPIRGSKEDKLEKFSEGTLFYVFFNHCGERIQKDAYERLLKLGWLFSREMQTFVQIVKKPGSSGLILYFDYSIWKKVTKEISIDQEFLSTLEGGLPGPDGEHRGSV
ncbi:hypothetical protein NEDG_01142 [Nematocida displodere]|uniref:NOT2/NOT3/NOT5 C-terminal domain-containing protein n=1 Tax=Nematocida displodere TaxID=1805483 RepID=A0A177EAN4_9MICR|nr:hypothetical protein NEDG_01142 [Nematocida displodere]